MTKVYMDDNTRYKIVESNTTTEVYVDVNDLIIDLMKELDITSIDAEKKVYRGLIAKLDNLRKKIPHRI